MKPELSIIIPTYNEEGNIVACINKIPKFKWKTEIIVSDDGTDNTAKLARELAKKRKEIIVLHFNTKQGKGGGFLNGLKKAGGDVVVIQDADYTVDPADIEKVVTPIFNNEADFVTGTRALLEMEKRAMSFANKIGNKIFTLLTFIAIQEYLTDVFCGTKAFRRNLLKDKLTERGWPDLDIIFQAKKNGLRFKEIPVHYKARKAGESKLRTFKTGYTLFKDLLDKTKKYYF